MDGKERPSRGSRTLWQGQPQECQKGEDRGKGLITVFLCDLGEYRM